MTTLGQRVMRGLFPSGVALLLAGCQDVAATNTFTLTIIAGSGQVVALGTVAPLPLQIHLADAKGEPVVGQTVTWIVRNGGGTVTPAGPVTDVNGNLSAELRVGSAPGSNVVRAETQNAAAVTFYVTATSTDLPIVASIPLPTSGGHFDSYIRDGIAFISSWNAGIRIYDVGNGTYGGTPASPKLVSSLVTSTNGLPGGPQVHNAWWFQNPVTHEKRYLFLGQETGVVLGTSSLGDLHVLDVSNLGAPVEVASLRIPNAGIHNFWMDEENQVLYAGWYNGGIVAVDVSGTLSGSLTDRIIAQAKPGGPNTFVWGVQVRNGLVYAADMLSGFWALDKTTLAVRGGGFNVQDRYTSELWVASRYAYTGTTFTRNGNVGDVINVWDVSAPAPVLVNSLELPGIGRVADLGVTPSERLLVVATEGEAESGLHVFSLSDPVHPVKVAANATDGQYHTAKIAVIGGRTYVFAASLSSTAIRIYDITTLDVP